MSELMPTEPYLLGSHTGCAGLWCSGPEDLPGIPDHYHWGYKRMTTVNGLVQYCLDNPDFKPELARTTDELVDEIYRPVRTFLEHKDYTTAIYVNPNHITPKMIQFRLQKMMDEYVTGVSTYYQTNKAMLEVAEGKFEMIKEDSLKLRAKDLHEQAARMGKLSPHPGG